MIYYVQWKKKRKEKKKETRIKIQYNVMRPLVLISRPTLSVSFIFVWDDLAINHCKCYIVRPTSVRQKTASFYRVLVSRWTAISYRIFWTRFLYVHSISSLEDVRKLVQTRDSYESSRDTRGNFSLYSVQTREDPSYAVIEKYGLSQECLTSVFHLLSSFTRLFQ